ncbi:MAG: DNA polymerase III subunit gamma/tau [Xenococcaceae cyanobacterium MO_234.B1]|nr:DNA polymerase III subunit gamma/tau [Xenococcaceae cyanobacterium MO_234.B1]
MSYEPLHHKYRPQTFGDLVGQSAIAETLINAIQQEKIAPAYLFTGPRGTGKTSSARILAKSLNCLKAERPTPHPCGECEVCKAIAVGTALDVIEIDAASNTGVDNIREIIERSQFAPVQSRYKVYAIDECHMLSTAAFNALLKTLEEPPPRVVFILATTDPQRVLPTIISRCQRFDYRRIPLEEMVKHLEYIAQQEQIDIDLEAIKLVGQIANGGLRDAESLLDQLSLFPGKITIDQVWDLVGAIPEQDLLILLQEIRNKNFPGILKQCRSLLDRGREPITVLQNLASFYLNLLIAKSAPQSSDLVSVTENCWKNLQQEASQWQQDTILWGQQKLKEAETQIKNTTQPRLWLEVTLFGLLSESPITSILNESVGNGSETSTLRLDTASPQLNGIKQPRHPSPAASPDFKISATNLSPSNPVPLGQHQEGESIVLESIGSTPKIEGNSPIRVLAPYEGTDSVVLRQNSYTPPDEESDRTQSSRQSSVADLNRNGVTSPPVQQLAPKRDSMEKTPDKVFPESKLEKVVSPTTTQQDTARYTETVKEQSESIAETEPVPVTESLDDSNIPASLESQPSLPEVDKEEIWQKAIAILKPPTTRTLLSQKCHLISIQDSMAIMGITSPKLRKLFQEKVSNIETAFSQVCQRTIKVSLEIAPNGAASAAKVSPPQAEVGTRRPVNTETHQETGEENNSSLMNVTPYKPPKSSNLKPEVDTKHSLEAKQDTFKQDTFKNGFNRELETPQEKIRDITPDITTSSKPDISAVTTSIPESQSLPETVVDSNISESEAQGGQTTVVSSEAEFTKAVELIAKSFDGEIITLDNYSYTEEFPSTQPQIVETPESLPPETTTDNDISNDISLKKKENYDRGIVSNRPDCSMYDYEDVPFARPINLEIKELELQDSWEWAVNKPGKWLYGKNYLLS